MVSLPSLLPICPAIRHVHNPHPISLRDALLVSLTSAGSLRALDDDESIYSARQAQKQVRALLRLLRPALGRRVYRFANREVRAAAEPLRSARDATVLLQTLDSVSHPNDGAPTRSLVAQLRRQLAANCRKQRRALRRRQLQESVLRLEQLAELLRNRLPKVPELEAAPTGLQQVYRKGRAAYLKARRHPTTQALHEWRKQVKYLYLELTWLHGVYRSGIRKVRRKAKELAELLGNDHDLALLRGELLEADPKRRSCKSVLKRIRHARCELKTTALHAGKRLYAMKPGQFADQARRSLRRRARRTNTLPYAFRRWHAARRHPPPAHR
jgi:CHAD domain